MIRSGDHLRRRVGDRHAETDLAGLPAADAYLRGDLNADGFNDIYDFQLFKDAYEAANGVGAFAQMIAAPEPSALAMTTFALLRLAPVIRRPQRC